MDKFKIQEDQYAFPYHYIASLTNNIPSINKKLSWGFEYITYIDFVRTYIEQKIQPSSLLDIGCGDGYLVNSLAYDQSKQIKGIDLSERAIGFAKAFSNGYEFECVDLFKIDQKFNVVCLIEVLEHIPEDFILSFVDESFSKVEMGGYMIISVPTTVEKVHKKHYRHYDELLLEQQINQPEFEVIEQFRIYKKSRLLEKLIKFSQKRNSKKIKRMVWSWHKNNTYYADKNTGKHLVTIYQRTS